MHNLASYAQCVSVVELEVERLKDLATKKSHSTAMIAQVQPKAKISKERKFPSQKDQETRGLLRKRRPAD